jgi:hypothetical protein
VRLEVPELEQEYVVTVALLEYPGSSQATDLRLGHEIGKAVNMARDAWARDRKVIDGTDAPRPR